MDFKEDLIEARNIFKGLLFDPECNDPIVCSIHDLFHDSESDQHNSITA